MSKIRIYLDNCCFNRPYDDQTQLRIELETKSKLFIQQKIIEGKYILVSSVILEYENSKNPYHLRQIAINNFLTNSEIYIGECDEVIDIARVLTDKGLRIKDASHLACAVYGGCDYFITTDDRLLKFKHEKIKIVSPIAFLSEEDEII